MGGAILATASLKVWRLALPSPLSPCFRDMKQSRTRKALRAQPRAPLYFHRQRYWDSISYCLRSCLDNEMRKTTLDYWVGGIVVLGAIALLFLALKVGNMNAFSFSRTYPLELTF